MMTISQKWRVLPVLFALGGPVLLPGCSHEEREQDSSVEQDHKDARRTIKELQSDPSISPEHKQAMIRRLQMEVEESTGVPLELEEQ